MNQRQNSLQKWIVGYGVGRLARTLGINRVSVQRWIGFNPRGVPSELNAGRIVALSQAEPGQHGPLELSDIFPGHEAGREQGR